jgi:hypothetical protein
MRNFIGRDGFLWFVGVVEDRNDPVQLGRVRVRCFGHHTDKKSEIATEDLPWAQVMNGINSASVNGLGNSPTGMVEGSWVMGFFMDGERAQEPVVMGTLPGIPSEFAEKTEGFSDPTGTYPLRVDEPDVNRAAREDSCRTHPARVLKNANRVNDNGVETVYPTARPPRVSTVATDRSDSYYGLRTWTEIPAADDYISQYPKNHVRETESGHLEEFDDTPEARRYHRFHPAGTYEEIINDGTRTIRIQGDDHEIVIQGKNMFIGGDWNVTVEGTKRELIKGNYHLEVEGEVSYDFKKSWQRKIAHNEETEIGLDRTCNIKDDDYLTLVKGNSVTNVSTGQKVMNIQQDYTITVNEDYALTTAGNTQIFATGDYKQTNLGVNVVTSKGNMTTQTKGSMQETIEGNQTTDVTGNVDINATRIDLN